MANAELSGERLGKLKRAFEPTRHSNWYRVFTHILPGAHGNKTKDSLFFVCNYSHLDAPEQFSTPQTLRQPSTHKHLEEYRAFTHTNTVLSHTIGLSPKHFGRKTPRESLGNSPKTAICNAIPKVCLVIRNLFQNKGAVLLHILIPCFHTAAYRAFTQSVSVLSHSSNSLFTVISHRNRWDKLPQSLSKYAPKYDLKYDLNMIISELKFSFFMEKV